MNKYIFTATIYPERVNFTLLGLPPLLVSSPEWNINGEFSIEIHESKVTVFFTSEAEYSPESEPNIETVKNFVEKIARTFVDTYCFVHSYNYDLTIDTVKCVETGLEYTFSVVGEFGFIGNNENFTKYLNIILQKQSNAFGDAFADYRRSIKYPDMTAAHCLRSIESIRRMYFDDPSTQDNNKRDKDGWKKMAKEINVKPDASYDLMQQFATPNRHGVYPAITWEQRKEIMTFTRNVVEKSLEWLDKN